MVATDFGVNMDENGLIYFEQQETDKCIEIPIGHFEEVYQTIKKFRKLLNAVR